MAFDIVPSRTALVAIDMQNCFVADSPVAAPLGLEVAARLNDLAGTCRSAGVRVIWTRHVVRPDHSNVGTMGDLIPAVGQEGGVLDEDQATATLHSAMDVQPGDIVLDKPRYGSFHGTDLELILRSNGIDTLILGGINTNVCVETTAREAAMRDYDVYFLSDGSGNFDLPDGPLGGATAEELQRATCALIAFGFGHVVTVEEIAASISAATPAAA